MLVMLSDSFFCCFSHSNERAFIWVLKGLTIFFLSSSNVIALGMHAVQCLGLDEF